MRPFLSVIAIFAVSASFYLLPTESRKKESHSLASTGRTIGAKPQTPEKTPALTQKEVIELAGQKTPSLAKLEGNFLSDTETDLQVKIESSKSRLTASGLLLKQELQPLNEQEVILVLTELRTQHVLYSLLAKKKLENIRRTYL